MRATRTALGLIAATASIALYGLTSATAAPAPSAPGTTIASTPQGAAGVLIICRTGLGRDGKVNVSGSQTFADGSAISAVSSGANATGDECSRQSITERTQIVHREKPAGPYELQAISMRLGDGGSASSRVAGPTRGGTFTATLEPGHSARVVFRYINADKS
ncbi:MAG: hypothetical protein ACT4PP_16115 [Sporichthyaceae bacterium]